MSKQTKRKAARSGSRPCDLCNKQRRLVLHHINGRDIPNAEALWNKCWICPDDHDSVHTDDKNGIVIEGWVQTTNGKVLAYHKRGEPEQYLTSSNPPLYTTNKT